MDVWSLPPCRVKGNFTHTLGEFLRLGDKTSYTAEVDGP